MKKYRGYLILVVVSIVLIIYKIIPISDKSFEVTDKWIKKIEEGYEVTKKEEVINKGTYIKIKHMLLYPLDDYKLVIENQDFKVLYYGDYKASIKLNFNIEYDNLTFSLIDKNNNRFYFSNGKSGYVTFNIVDKPIRNRSIEITLYNTLHLKYDTRYKMNISVTRDEYKEFGWEM
ncbi:hypothetical protein G1K97_13040 [Tenacibaculum finnmarkense]|uniref:hypothetical protein n=1 Tax=Tenacibaculum finnmarkense TaxID=2781243 RepID=UPI001EFBC7A0|nr:hypothetical protein [Tenacibaculum finnmarkense]MCG8894617.1 hypothetical protein [Tenacibaculum finnmarkense]MCG8902757.1 hypothetical protein [Tenacibaculum finnmarkense]